MLSLRKDSGGRVLNQTVITIGSIVTAETSPQLAATIKAPAANSYLAPDKNNQALQRF
ncbi:hypothetical protein [Nostoc sp.]|uniref:hypothetical protein n=1 Tax=Nostoc sp. TaxID=1180 RepID=UPI002FF98A3C